MGENRGGRPDERSAGHIPRFDVRSKIKAPVRLDMDDRLEDFFMVALLLYQSRLLCYNAVPTMSEFLHLRENEIQSVALSFELQGVFDLISRQIARPLALTFSFCVHCGMWAEAFLSALARADDPTMNPASKADQTGHDKPKIKVFRALQPAADPPRI
jgi:hypothetical protein